ncbi:A24 family peptidase [Cohnella fermenti]|uniref:Prepilin peptidase n=1 Tax=Cohnella fermenti TaxID=2565925 RepID=A0A4S4BLU8_9BACL|nr:A24 family peptidase [Cohnella fermenti]THF74815.1 prepilin peptidase [Cohnella fermenti]
MELVVRIALLTLTAIACWTDFRRRIIPNALTICYACGGLLYHGAVDGWRGLIESLLGGAAAMAPFLLMYLLKGIGGGDVKWFAAFGIWSGAAFALRLAVHSILAAGLIAVPLLLVRHWRGRGKEEEGEGPGQGPGARKATFPFMAAVAPALILLFCGPF